MTIADSDRLLTIRDDRFKQPLFPLIGLMRAARAGEPPANAKAHEPTDLEAINGHRPLNLPTMIRDLAWCASVTAYIPVLFEMIGRAS